ncbi:MAG TPA: nickel/cobalt transporter, partial [Rhizobiaceae bacterium]|nr:nickel/cobalt transporter [Rhizobiaceae bacterium]
MRLTARNVAVIAALAAACISIFAAGAEAANSLGLGAPEQAIRPEGFFASTLMWIQQQQQDFYRLMTTELKGMREDGSHIFMLAGLSFAYGVVHAAGPGHGKAVISSYMVANEIAARRGIVLAFASAFMQALTAIAVIALLSIALRGVGIKMADATKWLEIASFAGVTALGAWLLWRKIFGGGHDHGHAQGHDHAHVAVAAAPRVVEHAHAGHHHDDRHHHHHDHHGHAHHGAGNPAHGEPGHVHDSSCGHLHAPDPKMLSRKDFNLRDAWTAILAVGLRPCSGALIVLTFAFINGLWLAGIASTFAMALGTGLTVAVLAALAVWAKDAAIRVGGAAERG